MGKEKQQLTKKAKCIIVVFFWKPLVILDSNYLNKLLNINLFSNICYSVFPLFVLGYHELGNFKNLQQLWRSAVNLIPCKCVTFIICKIKSCHKFDHCLLNRRWGFSLCVIWSQRVFFCLPVSCVGNYKWKSSGKFRRAHVATWHKDPFRWEAGEISVRREKCTVACRLVAWPRTAEFDRRYQ